VRGRVSVSGGGGGAAVLGGLHQFDAEPADLRVLQPRLPGSVQEHAAVGVLQSVPAAAVRPRLAGRATRVAALRRPHAQRLLRDVPQQDNRARPAPLKRVRQQPLTLSACDLGLDSLSTVFYSNLALSTGGCPIHMLF